MGPQRGNRIDEDKMSFEQRAKEKSDEAKRYLEAGDIPKALSLTRETRYIYEKAAGAAILALEMRIQTLNERIKKVNEIRSIEESLNELFKSYCGGINER